MKKVIARLGNGLGNQLFIYAAAYAFAKKNNARLFVDNESGFYKRCKYELNNFEISSEIIEKKYKFIGLQGRIKRKILHKLNYLKNKKIFLIEEKDKNKLSYFNPNQFEMKFDNKIYFEGYFQSEKYFLEYKKEILKELIFKSNILNQESYFKDKITSSNSVSIHIRQDKFLPSEGHIDIDKLNKENLELNLEIIKKGINFFDKTIDKPTYFVWSNNFKGLRELFSSKKFIFVDVNLNRDAAYDMNLMSLCKHFILSPSAMHYWAAFLSQNNDKICIAPKNVLTKSGYYSFSNNKDIKPNWWTSI